MADTQSATVFDDIRASLAEVSEEVVDPVQTEAEAPEAEEQAESQPSGGRQRGPDGRFLKAEQTEESPAPTSAEEAPTPAEPVKKLDVPKSWKPEHHATWASLSPQAQEYILRREQESQSGVDKLKADYQTKAQFAEAMQEAVRPYEAQFRALNTNSVQAVQSLLNTDYQLRTADPMRRAEMFRELAGYYGVDLGQVTAEVPTMDPTLHQFLHPLQTQVQQLTQHIQATQRQSAERELQTNVAHIQSFAAEKGADGQPLRPHFEAVQQDMLGHVAVLRQRDPSLTPTALLQKAYEAAVFANPEIRAQVLAAERQRETAQKVAAAKAKADLAKKASVSVRGNPGTSAVSDHSDKPVRDILREELESRA